MPAISSSSSSSSYSSYSSYSSSWADAIAVVFSLQKEDSSVGADRQPWLQQIG
jgi:hypothetical protein